MDMAGAKAAYRLFSELDVTPQAILEPHRVQTLYRMKDEPVVLLAQDTTVLNYTTHLEAEGFGNIGGGYSTNHGCFLHSALAINAQGVPLGVLTSRQWSRAVPAAKRESARWSEVVQEVAKLNLSKAASPTRVVHLADQEGDDWSLLSTCQETGSSFVIRGDGLRTLKRGLSIIDRMKTATLLGTKEIFVNKKALRKGKGVGKWKAGNDRPASAERIAEVEVRVTALTLSRPSNKKKGLGSITCTVLSIVASNPPKGVKDPLEWFLMTDETVTTLEGAEKVIGWYRTRWSIETWHRTLKSGIKVEECRLASHDRMTRFIALAAVLAWRIEWMAKVSREQPNTPIEAILNPLEIQVLQNSSRTKRRSLTTVSDAIHQIATLGGFAGRKGDGNPGSKTLWLGWISLMDRVDLLQNLSSEKLIRNVGKR